MSLTERELYRWIDRSPIGMYRGDQSGRLYYVNRTLVRMLGYDSAEELLEKNLESDIYADSAQRSHLFTTCSADGRIEGRRVAWRTKQSTTIIVEIWGQAVRTPDGIRLDVSVLDLTAEEQASKELAEQRDALAATRAMLDLVATQMSGIYWVIDNEQRLRHSGGAIPELFGFSPGQHRGKTPGEAHQSGAGTMDSTQLHRRALAGETITHTSEFQDKYLVTKISPYRKDGPDAEIVGAVGTCVDVTSHYLLERRMVDAQRAESLGVLAGGLAHDFNNLLVAVLGNADLALRELPPRAPGRMPLENIRQASLRAAELIEQLLAYAGHGSVASTRVSPGVVIDELLRISAPTMPDNVSVMTDIAPELTMRGDASQIRQVLLNLISNARDALGARGGTISVAGRLSRHDGTPHIDDVMTAPAGSYIELEVTDDGPGISRETRRRIFEPFFTTKPTGHGLGLASVVGIVRAHGGGLRLTTSPGRGARFHILWPSGVTPSEVRAETAPGTSHTVLIIDDEDLVRDVVARMVEDLGYSAITATDGPAGLAIVDSLAIDAVLVDLSMPRMPGSELIHALRARRPELPIVLCSGTDRDRRGIPANAYLAKPFRLESLEQTLAKLLPR